VLINPPYVSLTDRSVPEGQSITLHAGYSDGTDLSFDWDLAYDGQTFDSQGTGSSILFDATGLDGPTTRTVALRATDRFGNRSIATATVTVTNRPPTLHVQMPYNVYEGSSASIYTVAYEYSPVDQATVKREFDFGNDGTVEATLDLGYGAYVNIPPEYLADGPGSLSVRVRAFDNDGGQHQIVQEIIITNAAPSGSVAVDATDVGVATTVRVTASDPSPVDRATLRFSYDFDNNGVWDLINSPDSSATLPASYLSISGTRTARVMIADKDGGSVTRTASFNVSPGTVARAIWSPLTINEGGATTLQGTYTLSNLPGDLVPTRQWDFDYDGTDFDVDAVSNASESVAFPAPGWPDRADRGVPRHRPARRQLDRDRHRSRSQRRADHRQRQRTGPRLRGLVRRDHARRRSDRSFASGRGRAAVQLRLRQRRHMGGRRLRIGRGDHPRRAADRRAGRSPGAGADGGR
jgi:hypothetical protein